MVSRDYGSKIEFATLSRVIQSRVCGTFGEKSDERRRVKSDPQETSSQTVLTQLATASP